MPERYGTVWYDVRERVREIGRPVKDLPAAPAPYSNQIGQRPCRLRLRLRRRLFMRVDVVGVEEEVDEDEE
jgi:hypothetical protein